MKARWIPSAILGAALQALVGCGGGGSLVGFDDASITIAFDAPTGMDASGGTRTTAPPRGSRSPGRRCAGRRCRSRWRCR